MILLPAIDILDGKAVRLARGAFEEKTVYDADPVQAAERWAAAGARALHVVDLDGARAGHPVNLGQIEEIGRRVAVALQVGGGLRTIDAVEQAIAAGDEALTRLGERLVVSVDARAGRPAAAGWTEELDIPVTEMIERLGDRGVRRFVYSSIDRDGMLSGPDLEAARAVAGAVRGTFIYSGGIGSLADLRALVGLRQVNLSGVIVGKALYEQRFSVGEGQQALESQA